MAGFGDFGSSVGEYAARTGISWNDEWYGANPGEYEARMRRDAANWWSQIRQAEAQREAEELRKRLNSEYEHQRSLDEARNQEFRNWAQGQAEYSQRQMDELLRSNQAQRSQYDQILAEQRASAQRAEQARQAEQARVQQEREAKKVRQDQVGQTRQSYLENLNSVFSQSKGTVGGRYARQMEDTANRYRSAMDAYVGSDNLGSAQAAVDTLGRQYSSNIQDIQRSYGALVSDSQNRIGSVRQQQQGVANQFRQGVQQSLQALTPATAGLVNDGYGLYDAAALFGQQQQGLLSQGIGQSEQVQSDQQKAFQGLEQGALTPDDTYEQRRDSQLADIGSTGGFLTSIYSPNFTGLQSSTQSIDPLRQQALATYQKTYGYDQNKLQEYLNPIQETYQQKQDQLRGSYQTFSQQLPGLLTGLGSGLFGAEQVAQRQARQNAVNQQLRGFEQNMQGLLSNYYNTFSNFATMAENEFNEQKAFRLNQRENLLANREQSQVDTKVGNAIRRREMGRVKQQIPLANLYSSDNLLTYLSRGNY